MCIRLRYFYLVNPYRVVLNPPLSLIAFINFMYLSIAFAIWAAFDFNQALITILVLLLTLPFLWRSFRMVIEIDDQELRIDRAHIELKYLKNVTEINESEFKDLRGRNIDARSFHATRAWLKRGVKVELNDERDPTNYWLIGAKRNTELVNELTKRIPYKQR